MVIAADSLVSDQALQDPCNILPAVRSPLRLIVYPSLRQPDCRQPNLIHVQLFI